MVGFCAAALLRQQSDRLAEAAAGAVDVAAEQQRHRQVLVGFGVLWCEPPRFSVGLQRSTNVAQAAADQPQVVPAQADLGGCGGGALAELLGFLRLALLEQQRRQVEPSCQAQPRRQGQLQSLAVEV